jgi:phosphoenolpyruvate-protein kinase (PTS system EI component)
VRRAARPKGLPFDDDIQVGIMVEVPAAVLIADHLVRLVDFLSIGTNDLTQYIMAADRTNAALASLTQPFQPPVIRAIQQIVATRRTVMARGCRSAASGRATRAPRRCSSAWAWTS